MTAIVSDLVLALDPAKFAKQALSFEPDEWQTTVLRWCGLRLLMNCSRQSGKSTTAAILALHTALYCPGTLVLLVSPSLRQSSELFRKVTDFRQWLEQEPILIEDNRLSLTYETGSRIVSLPGDERTIRGYSGADLIIEDEAARVTDDLYYSVRPMLAVSGGRLILMSTPFGKRGHFFEAWENGGMAWKRVRMTAEECPRISAEFLEEERQAIGSWWFAQEYMCEFVEAKDQVFSYDLIKETLSDEIKPLWVQA